MKIMRNKWNTILGAFILGLAIFSCKKTFLERPPEGAFSEVSLANAKGINATVIAAYALLDGWSDNGWNNAAGNPWPVAGSNWIWGSVASDDAYPGSQPNDQPGVERVNRYEFVADDPYYRAKFQQCYAGAGKANVSIRLINTATDLSAAEKGQLLGEAKFLRAHYHFDAYKMWINVPFIDENVADYRVSNATDIFPKIEQDFKDAISGLAEVSSSSSGRATKGAAQAYLARAYMFVGKYAEAKPLLQAVISGGKYSLVDNYHDNFDASKQNNSEMIFAYKASVNDGAGESANGNWGDRLNVPHGNAPVTQCCGFHQPSQNLVNAFRTDVNWLPLFNTFNNTLANFATDNFDPRLDWTVGRTGTPYLDWGPHQDDWVRDGGYCGFFAPKKNVFHKAQKSTLSTASGWSTAPNAIDIPFIRYSDVLLMAAEANNKATAANDTKAQTYLNLVRRRAFAVTDNSHDVTSSGTNLYDAILLERRLELAMEGDRFFDLVRTGKAASVLGSKFVVGKHEVFPIPQQEVDISGLSQNPNY